MTDRPTDRPTAADCAAGDARPVDVKSVDPEATDRPTEPVGLRVALPIAVWGLSAITTFLAATGQLGFALWAGVTDWRQYLVPAGLELVAGAFMLLGYRRARRGHSPFLMWAAASAVGGFAIYTNVMHAGPRAGLLFGAASAITLLLWFAKLYDDYRDFREEIDENGLGLLWLTNTRLAFRAALVGQRMRIRKVTPRVMYAEVWIAVVDDAKQAGVKGWRLRRRTAWRSVMRSAGHPVADLPTFATVDRVSVVDRPTPPALEPTDRLATAEPTDTDPVAIDRPTALRRPTVKRKPQSATHLHRVWSTDNIANARLLRDKYGDRLPSGHQVRKDLGWSYDRATPAIGAYNDGADLDDDKERVA